MLINKKSWICTIQLFSVQFQGSTDFSMRVLSVPSDDVCLVIVKTFKSLRLC